MNTNEAARIMDTEPCPHCPPSDVERNGDLVVGSRQGKWRVGYTEGDVNSGVCLAEYDNYDAAWAFTEGFREGSR
jgi:hypothetical protein